MALIKIGNGIFNTRHIAHAMAVPSEDDVQEVIALNSRGDRYKFVGDDAKAAWQALLGFSLDTGITPATACEQHITESITDKRDKETSQCQ